VRVAEAVEIILMRPERPTTRQRIKLLQARLTIAIAKDLVAEIGEVDPGAYWTGPGRPAAGVVARGSMAHGARRS
jgi:hypothetical protein